MGIAAFVAVGCLAWGLPASAQASPSPPEVQTEQAEVIPGGAKLQGELNPGGLPTTYYFEYSADSAVECLGLENCWPQTAGTGPITGDSQQPLPPVEVTSLRMGETYRYRLFASNADGTMQSKVATFTVGFSPVITGLTPNQGPTSGGRRSSSTANLSKTRGRCTLAPRKERSSTKSVAGCAISRPTGHWSSKARRTRPVRSM